MNRIFAGIIAVVVAALIARADGIQIPSPNWVYGISSLGTGVATALGINVGSAGAPVTFNGALGTPSSGAATNLTSIPVANATGLLPLANGGCNSSSGCVVGTKITYVTSSQTITRATGVKSAIIECWGGGGGGAGAVASATGISAGGGGGGSSLSAVFVNAPASDYVVTIGTGGTAGSAGANNGGAGVDTTVTGPASCTGKGGAGGTQVGAGFAGLGGAGGVAGTGTFTSVGRPGNGGIGGTILTINAVSGQGGNGPFGGAATAVISSSGACTVAAGSASSGAGGGGACTSGVGNGAGQAGGSGGVRIVEFVNQ